MSIVPLGAVEQRYAPADFFLLRSASLPIDRLEALGGAGTAADDNARNASLQAWVRDPFVQAAIYLASPSLSERLSTYLREPSAAVFDELRPALFRYFVRMTSRATPFGLFASTSTGRIGAGEFAIGPLDASRRRTWLDLAYVHPLVAQNLASAETRATLNYVPNSTLNRADDGWRYMEETVGQDVRHRALVRVPASELLDRVLDSGRQAPTFEALIDTIVAEVPDVDRADAADYLQQLIDSQVLVPTLAPTLTGSDPLERLVRLSGAYPALALFHRELREVAEELESLDRQSSDTLRDGYRALAPRLLDRLPAASEKYLFHVDMNRDAPRLALSPALTDQVQRATEALRRMMPAPWPAAPLADFRQRFTERYGDREVPLMDVLDEDSGIGFEIDPGSRSNENLLADFTFGGAAAAAKPAVEERRTRRRTELLERAWTERQTQIDLTEADIAELSVDNPSSLPDVFTVLGCAIPADESDAAVFFLQSVNSGGGLLGRFCRTNPQLEQHVRALLSREEALQPEPVFAELVHLPDDRAGNVICRPALRATDMPCLGTSGLPRADQISIADLTVSVRRERIVLRSRQSGREVLPRLTCAHNVAGPNASIYRFLAALTRQDGLSGAAFGWGVFAGARYLPRVMIGQIVVSPASWRVDQDTQSSWLKLATAQRRRAIGDWRAREGVPRWIQVGQADNLLTLDLDNPWCLDALADDLNRSSTNRVFELIPVPAEFCLRSPDGRHAHEVVLPFVRRAVAAPSTASSARRPRPAPAEPADLRRFAPGSRWLYAKLYGSARATETVLTSQLLPLVNRWQAAGTIDRWHFLRYRDSDDHLRVRFHGTSEVLQRDVQPVLQNLFQRIVRGHGVWRCQFDTYEREVTRYGGAEAIELAEHIFDADSNAVAALLQAAPSDATPDWRWQLSIRFVDTYYAQFGLDLDSRERFAKRIESAFRREFQVEDGFEGQVSQRFRGERTVLDELLADRYPAHLRWAQESVEAFGERLSCWASQFRELDRQHALCAPLEEISASLAHMHVNRMTLSNPREHELIIHAFLHRLCRGRIGRRRRETAAASP